MSRGSGGTEYGRGEHWASPAPDVAEYKTLYACHPWPHVGGYQLSVFKFKIFDIWQTTNVMKGDLKAHNSEASTYEDFSLSVINYFTITLFWEHSNLRILCWLICSIITGLWTVFTLVVTGGSALACPGISPALSSRAGGAGRVKYITRADVPASTVSLCPQVNGRKHEKWGTRWYKYIQHSFIFWPLSLLFCKYNQHYNKEN